MRRGSIRLRLLLAGAVGVTLALLLAIWGLLLLFDRQVERVALSDLNDRLEHLATAVELGSDGQPLLPDPPRDPLYQRPYSGHYWQIGMGEADLRSRSLWDAELPVPDLAPGGTWTGSLSGPQGEPLLVLARALRLETATGETPLRIAVAIDRAELDQIRADFRHDLLPYAALLGLGLVVAGAAQVAVGLRPLSTLGARVAALNAGAQRIGADVPAEVRPLAEEIDVLLSAREAELERARARAGDLAHGLKTPLQALLGEAARLRGNGSSDAADGIEEIAWTMRAHVDRELARARTAAPRADAMSDPVAVAEAVASVLRRTPRAMQVAVSVTGPRGLAVRLDRADLTEALGALAENALRHARATVEIACHRRNDRVVLCVRDDGPGVAPDRLDQLPDRGLRLDQQGEGTGLGLAIAAEIAASAGGSLTLCNLDQGFEAEMVLPVAGRS
ncbi:HAMP domain-containing histidine kinase [Rubellimicrobium rubrum]|uniref:histidine kinase n=1 Tax=Rubellimicrobium rubrum TaxID=2585369 RepID=A0A5C4MXC2_9RHOB|nr:HAMP domain-containing sensor histidine kinase [Rubellimicrobium rubrum]TNC48582.1 HAMP domain-containing histidine kinase [Rubellimicrobium rubrum]